MDSRVVNKEIRSRVWHDLKNLGFTRRTSRSAWRHWADGVDVVNFQSFNAYNAGVLGCTTFSFAVNLGIWLSYIPPYSGQPKRKDGVPLPEEYECYLRRSLRKRLAQPDLERKEIWLVADDGSNVVEAVSDAAAVISDEGLPWFNRFRDPQEVLRTLTDERETMDGTWGFGNMPSPVRLYLTGYSAVHVGEYELATRSFEELLTSGVMEETYERVRRALDALATRRTS